MPLVAERTPQQREAIRSVAKRDLARVSFPDFLTHVSIRSDDPLDPTVSKWEPWPYLVEQAEFWATGASEVILKDRQLGYSQLAGAYAVWRARKGATVALISKGDTYAHELLAKCAFIEKNLPKYLRTAADGDIKTEEIAFAGGGAIRTFPSTPDAGISFTNQVVVMDEAAFHPFGGPNYAALRPTVSSGGQFIILSTADPELGSYGWFPRFYWDSKAGKTGYASRFVPWHVRPGRDAVWLETERRAYEGMPEHFDAYYADTDAQAFAGKSGLVFPMFSEARHVRAARIPIALCRRVVAGVDLGGGDPTAIVVLGLDANHSVHQYAEFYRRGPIPVEELAAFLSRFPVDAVECPPEQATVIATLAQTFGLPAHAANNKRGDGLNLMATLLENDRLTIEPDCRDSIAEFPGYRWAERTDPNDKTRYATKTPVDHHADAMDARRYAVMEILAMLHDPGAKMPTRTLAGRPLSRSAV